MSLTATFLCLFLMLSVSKAETLNCTLFNTNDLVHLKNCAIQDAKGRVRLMKSTLSKVQFDKRGLFALHIENQGCFWLSQKDILRKTHCYDNGSDYFKEGLARYVDEKNQFGYMDEKLKIVIPAQYTFAFPFMFGQAEVCMNCKTVKPPNSEYSSLRGGQWKLIDKAGKTIKVIPAK